jgi:hypothetical protein
MDITSLFVSQRKLRNPAQLAALVRAIRDGDPVPRIRLAEAEDGTLQVDDGHHRLVAYRLAGCTWLERHEYVLVQSNRRRPQFGHVGDLIARVNADGWADVLLLAANGIT